MRFRFNRAGVLAVAFAVAVPAMAQTPSDYTVPRTPWGDPDLQGVWPEIPAFPWSGPKIWANARR